MKNYRNSKYDNQTELKLYCFFFFFGKIEIVLLLPQKHLHMIMKTFINDLFCSYVTN